MRADTSSGLRSPAIYLALVVAQTVGSTVLFFTVFPLFQKVVLQSGQPQVLDASTVMVSMAAVLLVQLCYWLRYRYVPIWAPVRSAFIGHLLIFAGRVSFFFGGALFSAIFFRHVPQLAALPPLGQSLVKGAGVMALLFSVFCYSLELDRLGRAVEEGSRR